MADSAASPPPPAEAGGPRDAAPADTARLDARVGYHHGNLKEALVEAARRLVAERGPAGFTLVEAARLAGVSPAAPYRHFRDRAALLDELRRRGFALFGERLSAAARGADAAQAFVAMGRAYLDFARREPGYYTAMFASGTAPVATSPATPPAAAGDDGRESDSFAALVSALSRAFAASGVAPAQDPRLVALHIWALSHGVAMLEAAAMLPCDVPGLDADRILETAVANLMRGARAG